MSIQRASTSYPRLNQWKYDVFLSFRGDDTRKGFTDHLYAALEHQGILTFRDDPKLRKGEGISPALFAAVKESRFALIVLSQNYASSTWCLDELVSIIEGMKARQTVLPIFYDVDPSDVRKQTGSFRQAFIDHEERYKDEKGKVQRWRSALIQVASFSGWNSKDWYESKLIRDIVEVLWEKLQPTLYIFADDLVGMYSRLQPLNFLLDVGVDDVRFIGIWGMGGIGKTTMVRAVYERTSCEFEFSFLLTDVRDSVEKTGLLTLQKQLLSGIWTSKADITDIHEGATIIRRLLGHKKVLLILDDVNHLSHLKYLAGKEEWFGLGSRVLITTRNEHLLIEHGVERRLKVTEFNDEDSLQLFSWKAFKRGYPDGKFWTMSRSVINYAGGLPLALEVLGSFLHGRDVNEWKSALTKLERFCNLDIFDILKTSYDGLDDEEKKIFLDIACFFHGHGKDRVTEMLNSCDVSAIIGIKVLVERSLLTLLNGKLWMHSLLRKMGQEIVRRESPNEPGRCSRLWLLEDIKHVLSNNNGTETIEGIMDSTKTEVQGNMNPKSLSMMKKLRYLKINNGNLPQGLEYLPNSLCILDWTRYPLRSLPPHFNPQKLLELSLCYGGIEHVNVGSEPLHKLKTVNLSHSLYLVSTPNFKCMPYLEFLFLEGCIRLYEVDPGIEVLERLIVLNLKDCKNLVHFARSVSGLKSLKVLNLSGCSKINKLPNDTSHLERLEELYLNETDIKELPSSIGMLKGLSLLDMEDCKHLACLPSSVGSLTSLTDLNLSGCSKLDKLPDELGHVTCLEKLVLSRSGIREVPSFIGFLKNLKVLSIAGCKAQPSKSWSMLFNPFQSLLKGSSVPSGLSLACLSGLHSLTRLNLSDCNLSEEAIPYGFGSLASLKSLDLSKNQFVRLPDSIGQLFGLEYLDLDQCHNLQTLPESIGLLSKLEGLFMDQCRRLQTLPKLQSHVGLYLSNCISLDSLANQIGECNFVEHARCVNCFKMVENENCKSIALSLLTYFLKFQGCGSIYPFRKRSLHNEFHFVAPGNEIPDWYNHQSLGTSITLELHPGWFSNNWMGFTCCVVFRALKPLPQLVLWDLCYSLTGNGGESSRGGGMRYGGRFSQPVSDHIWLFYVCPAGISEHEWQDIYYQLVFSFVPYICWPLRAPMEDVQVKKCAVRVVYKEDVEELWQTISNQSNVGGDTKRGFQNYENGNEAASYTGSPSSSKKN